MNIQFRQGSEPLSEKLIARAQSHLEKIGRQLDQRQTEALAHVDVEKESGDTHSEQMWRATITLTYASESWNASELGATPELAATRALKDMQKQVRSSHSRKQSMYRKGAALVKRLRSTTSLPL